MILINLSFFNAFSNKDESTNSCIIVERFHIFRTCAPQYFAFFQPPVF